MHFHTPRTVVSGARGQAGPGGDVEEEEDEEEESFSRVHIAPLSPLPPVPPVPPTHGNQAAKSGAARGNGNGNGSGRLGELSPIEQRSLAGSPHHRRRRTDQDRVNSEAEGVAEVEGEAEGAFYMSACVFPVDEQKHPVDGHTAPASP
jgi:hypothetical protein